MRICEWKIPRTGKVGKWLSTLWLGGQWQRASEASPESAETMRKQTQGEDPRHKAGGIEAEKKTESSSVWRIPRSHCWILLEACSYGPYYLVYRYSKPLIFEVTWGSLSSFPQKSSTYRKIIESQLGRWGWRRWCWQDLAGLEWTEGHSSLWLQLGWEACVREGMRGEVTKVQWGRDWLAQVASCCIGHWKQRAFIVESKLKQR